MKKTFVNSRKPQNSPQKFSSSKVYAYLPSTLPVFTASDQKLEAGNSHLCSCQCNMAYKCSYSLLKRNLFPFFHTEERLSHAGKNPKRVGADFHRKLAKQSQEEEEEEWCAYLCSLHLSLTVFNLEILHVIPDCSKLA